MNNLWKKMLPPALLFGMLLLGFSAVAQQQPPKANPGSSQYPPPIPFTTLPNLIKTLLGNIQAVAIPLAILAVVIVGIQFIYGAVTGNQGLISQSKKILLWILIGAAIVIGATYLAEAMIDLLKNIGQTTP